MAELEIARKYEPGISDEYKAMLKEKIGRIKDYIGDDGILGTWVSGGPMNNASMIIDHNELYLLFMTEPEYYEKLMQYTIERSMPYTEAFIEAGADVMLVGGNVPGGFLGSDAYEQFILKWEKQYIDEIHALGCPTIYHNCGEIMELVDSYKQLGSDVIEPFSPVPLGDADLAKAVDQIQGEYSIIGGVDQVNVLQKGTKDEVVEATLTLMEAGKKNGPFIAQSADFLEYNTPTENVELFVKTALENANY